MMMRAAALLLSAAPVAFARVNSADINKDTALESLTKIASLKSMDMEDVMCDECLSEIDCIWPCEIMCVLDYPDEYAGEVCQICLEFFGCEGCKFLCPSLDTISPSSAPTQEPTLAPSVYADAKLSAWNYTAPSGMPSVPPTMVPTVPPTSEPTMAPTELPTMVPTTEPTSSPSYSPTEAPTQQPSLPPTSKPSYEPTSAPTMAPYMHPTGEPTYAPSAAPTAAPTVTPSAQPSAPPTLVPSAAPSFLLYYSKDNDKLYEYNPVTDDSKELFNADLTGDLKIDSVNYFMFWSEPTSPSYLVKYDLAAGTQTDLISSDTGIMGIALDPSKGTLYFCNQGGLSIDIITYSGENKTTLHDLASKEIVPYGIDVSPAEVNLDDDTDNDPGYLMFTGADTLYGYIYTGDLEGDDVTKIYTSDSKDLFGIVLDDMNSKMWWIENKGVANGLYNAGFDAGETNFIAYLEGAYWAAALWDEDLMYVADYEEGVLYEFEIEDDDIKSTTALVTADNMRCVAFWEESASSDTPDSGIDPGAAAELQPDHSIGQSGSSQASPMASGEPASDVVETGDAARDANGDAEPLDGAAPAGELAPTSGSEDTDQMVANAESQSSETDGVQTTEPPAWNAAPETSPDSGEEDTDAEASPVDEETVALGIKARPSPDSQATQQSQDLPPTDVNNGMSSMAPVAKTTAKSGKSAMVGKLQKKTAKGLAEPSARTEPDMDVPHPSKSNLKEESTEEEASGVPTGVLTVGGIAAAVALSAFVVYSRRRQGSYAGLGHEAI